jgi:hypothetical protein
VPRNLIFTDKEAAFLKALVKQRVDFMIVGLSAAALQGAPVVTQDIDLWFNDLNDPGIIKALKEVGGSYIPPVGINPPLFAGDAVKLFDIVTHMHGLDDFEKEKENSLDVWLGRVKIRLLSLERIIQSKKATNRPKDKLVLPVLKDALITIRESYRISKGNDKKTNE